MQLPCLDIIIPQYNESVNRLFTLLTSINNQVGLDLTKAIRVTIVNDHNDEGMANVKSVAKCFGFPIQLLQTDENVGAGLARQCGLDHTELPYVMFMDADDCLWDCGALMKLLNSIRTLEAQLTPWSYIWSNFYEEHLTDDKGYDLLNHNQPSMIWLHGKVWNRAFLNIHSIRFHPTLRTFEDTYFGKIVALSAPKSWAYHCTDVTYLWKNNPKSVTAGWNHDNRSYLYWNYRDYIVCTRDVLKFLYPNYQTCQRWKELLYTSIYFTYFLLQFQEYSDISNPETALRRTELIQLFKELVINYGDTIKNDTLDKRARWYNETRKDVSSHYNGFTVEHWPFNDFLQEVQKSCDVDIMWLSLDWQKLPE